MTIDRRGETSSTSTGNQPTNGGWVWSNVHHCDLVMMDTVPDREGQRPLYETTRQGGWYVGAGQRRHPPPLLQPIYARQIVQGLSFSREACLVVRGPHWRSYRMTKLSMAVQWLDRLYSTNATMALFVICSIYLSFILFYFTLLNMHTYSQ
jgi:hypothetical protein